MYEEVYLPRYTEENTLVIEEPIIYQIILPNYNEEAVVCNPCHIILFLYSLVLALSLMVLVISIKNFY